MSYPSEVLADSPDWYLRLGEPSGTFADSSPHAVVATEVGALTRSVTGPFTGSTGVASDPSDTLSLGYTATSLNAASVEGWFRTTTAGAVLIEQNRPYPSGIGFCLTIALANGAPFGGPAGTIGAFINSTSFWQGIHTTATYNDGTWHHVVATWQGIGGAVLASQLTVYVDGALATTVADSGNTGSHSAATISGSGAMTLWNGGYPLDSAELAFYSTALSAARVAVHYAARLGFTADFSGTPVSGDFPLTVAFTDESSGGATPATWLWDFGDGQTSTVQDPTHIYSVQGSYTVTLTVTTSGAETDTEAKTAYVVVTGAFVPPEPGGAILEIRAAATGSARWGVALWGEDVWAAAAWIDITPESIDAQIRWGSHTPEAGVLTQTEAATWLVDTYDPERLLDPGNTDSPYHADLRAGLPIRLRHRGTIVRQGIAETIGYFYKDRQGAIRATDNLSTMARTPVPSDSVLSDTLRARARDAIAAGGLRLTVEDDPPAGDPALVAQRDGDFSVWSVIRDAAEQVLHVAYVDRIGTVRFRAWASPYDRARFVDDTELIDLGTIVQTQGLYSVVQAQQTVADGGLLIERRLTPTPRYGAVTFTRSDETPDADAWAAAVLADRSLQTVQWLPGDIYPLDADAVEYFATLEAMERFNVEDNAVDPRVDVLGIIVGGEIRVTAKRGSSALWRFGLELAQTADSPLYTDTDPAEFLLNEAGDGYLYGD
jgi:PKD repeat protein